MDENRRGKGQPTKYNKELADKICRLIATHPNGLPTIIKKYGLPDRQTIYNWLNEYPDFFDKYMKAKEHQAHLLADEMIYVNEEIPTFHDKDGNERIDSGMIGRAKIKIDALKWSTATLAPRFYNTNKEKTNDESKNIEIKQKKKQYRDKLDEKNKKSC